MFSFKCVVCGKDFESEQPYSKFCSVSCRNVHEKLRQEKRYFDAGIEAIKLLIKDDKSLFLLGCEEIYTKLFGVKNKMVVNSDCDMVQRRKKTLLNKLKQINEQLDEIEELLLSGENE